MKILAKWEDSTNFVSMNNTHESTSGPPGGPLRGLRILDLSTVVMGPYASHLLADMGADVVKLEAPAGDQLRYYRPQRSRAMSGMFLGLHRNKRSIVLDLKSHAGRAAFQRLAAEFDVILHNFRPNVAKRLGATFEQLKTVNSSVVVCKIYGYGEGGSYAERPAYDDVIQAGSGIADLFRRVRGEPQYVPSMICDKIVGQAAAAAILAACYQRLAHGQGCEVEVPMFETMVAFNLAENLASAAFEPPLGPIGWARNMSPMRKPFRTADGYACLLPYSDRNWQDFLAFAGYPEVLEDARFRTLADRAQHIDELYQYVEKAARQKSTAKWLSFCEAHDIPCAPIASLDDLWTDPHLKDVELFQQEDHPTEGRYRLLRSPIRFDGGSWKLRRHAPRLGEHTDEVLAAADFSDEERSALERELLAGNSRPAKL